MPEMTDLKELLKHELGDLLYAERQFLRGTKKMAKEVSNPEMKRRLEEHASETEGQIERLNRAFQAIGEKAKAEKCDAAIGLMEEHDSFKSEEKPSKPLMEAFDLGSGLRVEHYEIAGYRSAIAIATALGEAECASLLKESLSEEEEMAKFLERNSLKALKQLKGQMAEA
jgi:ferritin-like metal-binding protein YciE